MGKSSREKGKRGERKWRDRLREEDSPLRGRVGNNLSEVETMSPMSSRPTYKFILRLRPWRG